MVLSVHEHLGKLSFVKGDQQEMCKRIYERIKTKNDRVHPQVLSTDMALIIEALKQNQSGSWQDLFREIVNTEATADKQDSKRVD